MTDSYKKCDYCNTVFNGYRFEWKGFNFCSGRCKRLGISGLGGYLGYWGIFMVPEQMEFKFNEKK